MSSAYVFSTAGDIPAASGWGLGILPLALLMAGTLIARRRLSVIRTAPGMFVQAGVAVLALVILASTTDRFDA